MILDQYTAVHGLSGDAARLVDTLPMPGTSWIYVQEIRELWRTLGIVDVSSRNQYCHARK
ncbi:hypothetical protein XAB3213_3770028 [Xanthomonas citri pv. bilvae]|nr:hypothetical protein XAB3213_3770028 [Xanthomonas citri pv. bilvae]